MTESKQDVAPRRGTGCFIPLKGRDPCQPHPKANNQQDSRHKRQHRHSCRGSSKTTAVYMPFSRTGTQFHPQGCLPSHAVCPRQGQLMLHTQPQQHQQTLMQLPQASSLGPRCSSDHSTSSLSSYMLQHNTAGDVGHPAMSAGFAAPARQVVTQQQTVLVQTHSLSSGSSTSSVHGALHTPNQGLGSCAAATVSTSTALQPHQALLDEQGSSGAKFSSLGACSSSSGGASARASQYSIWGPVGQQQQHEAITAVQGPCGSSTSLASWTAALQPSSSSAVLAPGAVYADQDHPVMQVAAAGSAGSQAGQTVYCAGQHPADVMQVMPAGSTGVSAGQHVYCAGATHTMMQIAPAVSTGLGVPAEQIVYCADPSQPVMQVAPAGAVFVLQAASTQQMQQYQLVPASTTTVGVFSQGSLAPSMAQWGH